MDGLFSPPPLITGLLGADEAERLRKQSIGTGIVSALIGGLAAAPSYRYTGIAPILGQALQSGFQGMQGTYTSALENFQTQQKIAEMQRQQQQQRAQEQAVQRITSTRPELADVITAYPSLAQDILKQEFLPKPGARMLDSEEKANRGLPVAAPYQIDEKGQVSLVAEPTPAKQPDFGDRREAYAFEAFNVPYASLTQEQRKSVNARIQEEDVSRTAAGVPKPPSQQPGYKDAIPLRQEFRATPEAKAYAEMQGAYGAVKAAYEQKTPIADVALATKLMKLLDPGSVVRESELAIAMEAAAPLDRILNYANRLKTGEKLTPTQREEFRVLAERIFRAAESKFLETKNYYSDIARVGGLDPNLVVGNVKALPSGIKVERVK